MTSTKVLCRAVDLSSQASQLVHSIAKRLDDKDFMSASNETGKLEQLSLELNTMSKLLFDEIWILNRDNK